MKTSVSLNSFLAVAFASLFLMGCPNNKTTNSNIPAVGAYGDRSQVVFAATSFNQPFIEQVNMPYAIAELGNVNGQMKMNLYFYEYELTGGANPCFSLEKERLMHNQTYQRSFTVRMVDYNSRQPQVIYQTTSGNTSYWNPVPSVYFQFTDRTTNRSLLESAFSGQVTVLESSYEGAYVRFDNVIANGSCYLTPENRNLACGSRLSGVVRVAFCR